MSVLEICNKNCLELRFCDVLFKNLINMNAIEQPKTRGRVVYKLVLTGGPCSGKTTGQARMCTFFENLGWKVFRVPETATVLLSGGVRFAELDPEEADRFQDNLLQTMIAMENCYFDLAATCDKNCLIICDRGTMDAAAFLPEDGWEKILRSHGWNAVELRDNRYNHIIHLVTAANGAEAFYNTEDNACRTETLDLARDRDHAAALAWIGHPYIDVIDNSTDFDTKMRKLISCVCERLGLETKDRLASNSRKVKFLVSSLPLKDVFPPHQDFEVVHDYLISSNPKIQIRIRKRGQNGNWSYLHTQRKLQVDSQVVEVKKQISHRDYVNMLALRDDSHYTVYKCRRCFLWEDTYFQLDIYKQPCHKRCEGLCLLEVYTALNAEEIRNRLPPFLDIVKEVTGDPAYSMYNLSRKGEWTLPNCK